MSSSKTKIISRIIISIIYCLIYILSITTFVAIPNNEFIWVPVFLFSILLFIHLRKFPTLYLSLFFIIHAAFIPYFFFQKGIPFAIYPTFQTPTEVNFVILTFITFLLPILIYALFLQKKHTLNIQILFKENHLAFLINITLGLAILIFGIQGETILSSGGYTLGSVTKSPLHEYFIIPFSLALLASPRKKCYQAALILLLISYSIKSTLYGGRIETIQVIFMYLLLRFNLLKNIATKKILIAIGISWITMETIGALRGNIDVILNLDIKTLYQILFNSHRPYIGGTFGDVMHSSLRIHGLLNMGIIDIYTRAASFFSFIFNIFLNQKFSSEAFNLAAYKQNLYTSGGGAFMFTYAYIWLGFFGCLVSGIFLAFIIHNCLFGASIYLRFYCLISIATFPRWFLYNPVLLVKLCIVGVVSFYLFRKVKILKNEYIN